MLAIITCTDLSYGTGNEEVPVFRIEGPVKKMLLGHCHTPFIHVLGLLVSAAEQKILLRFSVTA